VKGPKGTLSMPLADEISYDVQSDGIAVQPANDTKRARAFWGMQRTLVQNLVTGVTDGFTKKLLITGVGYRAAAQGKTLKLQLGYSHDVNIDVPEGIEVKTPDATTVEISGADKQKVGEYLDAVRDAERRIQRAEQQADREMPVLEQPAGIPGVYEDYVRLMLDLQLLAFQTDLTRVFSFVLVRESSVRSYPEIGVPDSHHPLSHHQNNAEKLGRLARVNLFLGPDAVQKLRIVQGPLHRTERPPKRRAAPLDAAATAPVPPRDRPHERNAPSISPM